MTDDPLGRTLHVGYLDDENLFNVVDLDHDPMRDDPVYFHIDEDGVLYGCAFGVGFLWHPPDQYDWQELREWLWSTHPRGFFAADSSSWWVQICGLGINVPAWADDPYRRGK